MRGKSHHCLGQYLLARYMHSIPVFHASAFLIGCVEPDRNPVTYLKGSIRCQWMRGHNYKNARRFMRTLSRRLEKKSHWNIYDYYALGKLIHYTADAFTFAHNDHFSTRLSDHREYEASLQIYFLRYLREDPKVDPKVAPSVMDAISRYHREYRQRDAGIPTDTHFALAACCCVLSVLFSDSVL